MKFQLLGVLACSFVCASYGQECGEKGMRKFDRTLAKFITFAGTGRKWPTNKVELKKYCGESEDLIRELEKHKAKCFTGMSKQVFGVLLYAIKNGGIKSYCKKESTRLTDLLESAPCLNRNDPIIAKCYTSMIDGIIGAKNADDKLKIPHLCCDITRFFECVRSDLSKAEGCDEKAAEVTVDFVQNIAQNVLDLICGDYNEGSDKCVSLGPSPKKKRNQRRTKSFAIPLLDLLSSFPEV